jgi:hypothetical protein
MEEEEAVKSSTVSFVPKSEEKIEIDTKPGRITQRSIGRTF